MKRNKLMAAACLLLALTMITTSTFSGVLAKYIVSDGATDIARVAKFGVVASASGDLFGITYGGAAASGDGNVMQTWTDSTQAYVSASAVTEKLIAPGTKNDKGLTFSVMGTPEVSTRLRLDMPEGDGAFGVDNADFANTDIYVKANNYIMMVPLDAANVTVTGDNMANYYTYTAGATDMSGTFAPLAVTNPTGTIYKGVPMSVAADYYPIAWNVNDGTTDTACANVAAVLAAVNTALGTATADYNPGHTFNKSATVTWEWAFGTPWAENNTEIMANWENTSATDIKDTVLGQMIAIANSAETCKIAVGTSEVVYKTVLAADGSANSVTVAYTASDSSHIPTNASTGNVVACLTATFGARLTVEQVDYVAAP